LVEGFAFLSPFLAAAIPLAIYNFLESLDNMESAEVEGDKFPTTRTMPVPGVLTIIGSFPGSPFPTIIYIGHPGWKKAGARVGYSMATGIAVLVLAFAGLLPLVMSIIPLIALRPILIFIAMSIGKQAFTVTPAIGWASGLDVAIGYGVMALGLLFFHLYKSKDDKEEETLQENT